MKIFLSVGDLSGDVHCAALVRELLKRHPDWQITALGGAATAAAGAQILSDTSGLGVIGFSSAMKILPRSIRLQKRALKWLAQNPCDCAILCDWGGFNTRLMPGLKQLEIPVLYYFPPRSWQQTGDGGLQIAPECAAIATPFAWSAQRLNKAGGHARWVGHPILEQLKITTTRRDLRAQFGIADDEQLIALMPGSRGMELQYVAPHVARACELLKKPRRRFAVAAAPGATPALKRVFGAQSQIIENRTFELLRAADFAIVKSGTSTLEAAVANCPQIVVYDVPRLLHWQAALTGLRKKIAFAAMPNIIAGRAIVPEILGDDCHAQNIADAVRALLEDETKLDQMRHDYREVRRELGEALEQGATAATADMVETIVGV